MFKLTAKEALAIHSNKVIKLLADISEEITKARLQDSFHIHFELPFDRKTDAGRENFYYICSLLTAAGYKVETPLAEVNSITVHIPAPTTRLKDPAKYQDTPPPFRADAPFNPSSWPGMSRANNGMNGQHRYSPFQHPESLYPAGGTGTPYQPVGMIVTEDLMWAAHGMDMLDSTKKELIKCCAKQIIDDKSGLLMRRYNTVPPQPLIDRPEDSIAYRVFEAVLPEMGMLLLHSSFIFPTIHDK
jgi:hypothetical protein